MDTDLILTRLGEVGATWGLRAVGVLVAIVAAWIFGNWVRNTIIRKLESRSFDASLTRFFASLARYSILVGAIVGCLGVFGIQTASFAAVIAAAGLAIGLAFQGSLSNFAAGVMLLVFRPFRVGDLVRIADELGFVQELEFFATKLNTLDNRRVIVPNSEIFGKKLENLTHLPERRVDVPVGVAYGADLRKTRQVLQAAIQTIPGALEEPVPAVYLCELGASSVDWELRVWCSSEAYFDVRQAVVEAGKVALDEAGIGIPFPQRDLHLDSAVVEALAGRRAA